MTSKFKLSANYRSRYKNTIFNLNDVNHTLPPEIWAQQNTNFTELELSFINSLGAKLLTAAELSPVYYANDDLCPQLISDFELLLSLNEKKFKFLKTEKELTSELTVSDRIYDGCSVWKMHIGDTFARAGKLKVEQFYSLMVADNPRVERYYSRDLLDWERTIVSSDDTLIAGLYLVLCKKIINMENKSNGELRWKGQGKDAENIIAVIKRRLFPLVTYTNCRFAVKRRNYVEWVKN